MFVIERWVHDLLQHSRGRSTQVMDGKPQVGGLETCVEISGAGGQLL